MSFITTSQDLSSLNKHEHEFIDNIYNNVLSKQRQMVKENNSEYLITVTSANNEVKHVGYKYMDIIIVGVIIKMAIRFSKENQLHLLLMYHHVMLYIDMLSKLKGCSITFSVNANVNRKSIIKQEIKCKRNTKVGITRTNSYDKEFRLTKNM